MFPESSRLRYTTTNILIGRLPFEALQNQSLQINGTAISALLHVDNSQNVKIIKKIVLLSLPFSIFRAFFLLNIYSSFNHSYWTFLIDKIY